MSLVGKHEVPWIERPEPKILESIVLPILGDIISRKSAVLRQLELPKKWRKECSSEMGQFLERYSDYLTNQRYCCLKCMQVIDSDDVFRYSVDML